MKPADKPKAKVTWSSVSTDQHTVELSTGHVFSFGGAEDGFCHTHSSFDCHENLSDDEQNAIEWAEEAEEVKQ